MKRISYIILADDPEGAAGCSCAFGLEPIREKLAFPASMFPPGFASEPAILEPLIDQILRRLREHTGEKCMLIDIEDVEPVGIKTPGL
ncbi:hypothetical protein DP939_38205 [Spongiactinospora rosea]|uniref:Uncharacterized protein n=1 Tax=Spongiactinospora rosea TaxID=2248750 RepID=A0A366LNM8_9ACTN|nr:hypothetical protein DP939_38205 [Spongiactinospora rosea]